MSNYMLHFALVLHVCSLPEKVGSCRLHWLTVCLNTTALTLRSKVPTKFNERERERRKTCSTAACHQSPSDPTGPEVRTDLSHCSALAKPNAAGLHAAHRCNVLTARMMYHEGVFCSWPSFRSVIQRLRVLKKAAWQTRQNTSAIETSVLLETLTLLKALSSLNAGCFGGPNVADQWGYGWLCEKGR